MGTYRRAGLVVTRRHAAAAGPSSRHRGRRIALPVFAFLAAIASVFVVVVAPQDTPAATAASVRFFADEVQSLSLSGVAAAVPVRDGYGVTKKVVVVPAAPRSPRATGDAGAAQAIAYDMVKARGWGDDQFDCLVKLFNRESHWNVYASNPSGAYGIPQALPGSKMASAGPDWQSNPATQIAWGLGYIAGRYGTPCGAWQASQTKGWY